MPRGQKSKARAREKRRQNQDKAQGLKDAQSKASEKQESSSCYASGDAVPSTSTAEVPQKSQKAPPPTTAGVGNGRKKSGKGARGRKEAIASSSEAGPLAENPERDLLTRKTGIVMQYLLCKYKLKQPIRKGEMLKIINRRFKDQFPEILKKASERIQLVFGLEVKEIKPNGDLYTLVSKLDPNQDGGLTSSLPFPQNGLLMPLLGVIFLNGNRASEEEIWEFLNILGIFDGKIHIIFGNPRELITKDLVREKYLEYQQVANSDPPHYEFLWGPRAHAETSKMKVLQFLATVNETVPSAFPSHYEEALKEEEERLQAEGARHRRSTAARAKAKAKAKAKAEAPSKDIPDASPCP